MITVDYRTHCAWCHAELGGTFLTFLPAFDYQMTGYFNLTEDELAIRYCTGECVGKRRDELMNRRKFVGEKWPRWSTEIPPEVATMIEVAVQREMAPNQISRPAIVRWALREWLTEHGQLPRVATDSTAMDITDQRVLIAPDLCPMGCGRTTDDAGGGPCSECWADVT